MSLVKWTLIGLLVLPAAELFAFFLVAALIGWLWAAVLLIATSLAGVLLLRRSGRADLDRLRAAFARDGVRALHLETPGVATDGRRNPSDISRFYNGPLGRRAVAAGRFAGGPRQNSQRWRAVPGVPRRDDRVIELEPGEWHQIPDRGQPPAA